MTSYSIDPQGVRDVLANVQKASDDLSAAVSGVSGAHDDVTSGAATCTAVPNALAAFLDAQAAAVTDVTNRISACLFGAATATTDYVQADETMSSDVTQAQTAAVDSASSGDFSWFTARAGGR
jgi:prophage DNA circulation protein